MNTTAIPHQVLARRVWLCDLDGTLVDSAPAHAAAYRAAIEEFAPELLRGFRYDAHAGATTREVMAGLGADPETADRMARRKQQRYRSYVDDGLVVLFPGVRRLVDHITDRGDRVYVVTSGSRPSVERVLASCGLDGRLAGVLTGDDITRGKPDPAAYREACQRWAVHPDDIVVLEDSPHGVASAVGAGLVTLRVHTDEPLPGAIPVPSLDHLADLLATTMDGARG